MSPKKEENRKKTFPVCWIQRIYMDRFPGQEEETNCEPKPRDTSQKKKQGNIRIMKTRNSAETAKR